MPQAWIFIQWPADFLQSTLFSPLRAGKKCRHLIYNNKKNLLCNSKSVILLVICNKCGNINNVTIMMKNEQLIAIGLNWMKTLKVFWFVSHPSCLWNAAQTQSASIQIIQKRITICRNILLSSLILKEHLTFRTKFVFKSLNPPAPQLVLYLCHNFTSQRPLTGEQDCRSSLDILHDIFFLF